MCDDILTYDISPVTMSQNPIELPAKVCWSLVNIPQKVTLSRSVPPGRRLIAKYAVKWEDIMKYCRANNDVDWLLRGPWQHIITSLGNIFEILFLEYEQFREYIFILYSSMRGDELATKLQKCANDRPPRSRTKMLKAQHDLLINNLHRDISLTIRNDLKFIGRTNTLSNTVESDYFGRSYSDSSSIYQYIKGIASGDK